MIDTVHTDLTAVPSGGLPCIGIWKAGAFGATGERGRSGMAALAAQNRYAGGPSPSGLADVLDLILEKGLVIDLYRRVSLLGMELVTVDARVVVASGTP